ncbi:CYTH domain-containing protein [Rhizobium sp. KVB221]|uniref:CYTH domain-containing protein n=1 Tax=Rhizobium setariae TaxID=2801340 RepID=A0A936YSF4_9HYPH|nr:CYTH domain-containing protein [Rhizobium setariae]MBL0372031.1 CYTH domain-containing protein [Rhizobium setariae]
MPKEIERKFLVATDDWRKKAGPGKRMRQAIIMSEDRRSLRIRAIDQKKARLTLKIGISGMSRHEFEYDVPIDEAEELLTLANGTTIAKTRYEVKHGKFVWEVDVYEGALAGLVVAEVEMKSETDQPQLPPWLGQEVTGDKRYSNQSLAEGSLGENLRDGI